MRILYFAWVRERTGTSEETLTPPTGVTTASALADWLATRSEGHASAFADHTKLRLAINHEQADFTAPIAANDEIAFFPPMTGG